MWRMAKVEGGLSKAGNGGPTALAVTQEGRGARIHSVPDSGGTGLMSFPRKGFRVLPAHSRPPET